jgi:predicted phage baseplate assembly protein
VDTAASLLTQDVRARAPQVQLDSQPTQQWSALRFDRERARGRQFVVEIDNDGIAHLRFGDGELGFQPPAGMTFRATYRAGNGTSGNVGAETISCLVTTLSGASIIVRNPLPAQGGTDAEPMAEAKLFAPSAFRDPKEIQRAIIAGDYELIAERNPRCRTPLLRSCGR